ncbi:MAG: hypothetical protein DMF74_23510 [Acidobacteria bacterium]|nr:MAG: hypothetical protein DMF74_23510 [Acidobacteriota bacterium]
MAGRFVRREKNSDQRQCDCASGVAATTGLAVMSMSTLRRRRGK